MEGRIDSIFQSNYRLDQAGWHSVLRLYICGLLNFSKFIKVKISLIEQVVLCFFYIDINNARSHQKMNKTLIYTLFLCLYSTSKICSQGIADFTPLSDFPQNVKFAIPQSHTFQKIIESGDPLTTTGNMYVRNDFTCLCTN